MNLAWSIILVGIFVNHPGKCVNEIEIIEDVNQIMERLDQEVSEDEYENEQGLPRFCEREAKQREFPCQMITNIVTNGVFGKTRSDQFEPLQVFENVNNLMTYNCISLPIENRTDTTKKMCRCSDRPFQRSSRDYHNGIFVGDSCKGKGKYYVFTKKNGSNEMQPLVLVEINMLPLSTVNTSGYGTLTQLYNYFRSIRGGN